MSGIEAEQEGSASLASIISDLFFGTFDSSIDSFVVTIREALNLIRAEPMGLDAFLEFISPQFCFRQVAIMEFASYYVYLIKLRELSKPVVVGVVDDDADFVIGLKVAAYHS